MSQQESYRIGPGLRDKLRDVVRTVDALSLSSRGPVMRVAHQDARNTGGGNVVKICEFQGGWNKGQSKTVTFKYPEDRSPRPTATATNLFADIGTAQSSTRTCAVAKDGTAWFLIAAEC